MRTRMQPGLAVAVVWGRSRMGQAVGRQLLEAGTSIRALSRRTGLSPGFADRYLTVVAPDFANVVDLTSAFVAVDAVPSEPMAVWQKLLCLRWQPGSGSQTNGSATHRSQFDDVGARRSLRESLLCGPGYRRHRRRPGTDHRHIPIGHRHGQPVHSVRQAELGEQGALPLVPKPWDVGELDRHGRCRQVRPCRSRQAGHLP